MNVVAFAGSPACDSDGARWTTKRWQDREIITISPPPDRR